MMTDEGQWALIRGIAAVQELRSRLYLVTRNVDFDVAFSLKPHEVTAWTIILGELDGGEFDWASRRWKKQDR